MPPLTLFGQTDPALNPYGTVGEPAYSTTNPPPSSPAGAAPAAAPTATSTDAYEAAKAQAQARIDALEQQRTELLASLATASLVDKDTIGQRIRSLETALASAYRDAAVTARASAAAASKAATSTTGAANPVALMKADADSRRADAMATRAEAYAEGTGAKRQQLEADSRLKDADANVAQARADLAAATAPDEIAKAHLAVQQAEATLQSTTAANKAAGYNTDILAAKAAVAPRVEAAGAATAEAGATTAQATAANAVASSSAALQTAQANAQAAQLAVQSAQAQFDATTPEMRSGALQADLDAKRAAAAQAQQNLQFAQDAHQTALAQGQATLEATQANTQKGLLGPLYGAQQKADELAAMLRAGTITDPAQAHQILQDYVTSAMRGTTPYEQQSTALANETQRRQQDLSLAATQSSTLGSFGGSLFGSMAAQNKDAPAGSNAMAQSYGGIMAAMMQAQQSMRPNTPADSPLLRSMSLGGGVSASGPPPPAAPATTIAPDGTVTIQHTPQVPLLGPGMAGTNADPMMQGSPAFLGGMGLAMPQHVDALWANDPHLQQDPRAGGYRG